MRGRDWLSCSYTVNARQVEQQFPVMPTPPPEYPAQGSENVRIYDASPIIFRADAGKTCVAKARHLMGMKHRTQILMTFRRALTAFGFLNQKVQTANVPNIVSASPDSVMTRRNGSPPTLAACSG